MGNKEEGDSMAGGERDGWTVCPKETKLEATFTERAHLGLPREGSRRRADPRILIYSPRCALQWRSIARVVIRDQSSDAKERAVGSLGQLEGGASSCYSWPLHGLSRKQPNECHSSAKNEGHLTSHHGDRVKRGLVEEDKKPRNIKSESRS